MLEGSGSFYCLDIGYAKRVRRPLAGSSVLASHSSLAILAISLGLGFTSPILLAAPQAGIVQHGQGSINQQGAVTTISQHSQRLDLNWQSFDIQNNETVNFVQPGQDSLAVNHILGSNGSQIHGQINANGQVWLINPNGIIFSKSAQVNVGALLASTLQEASNSSTNINFIKTQKKLGGIKNFGNIQSAAGGYIAFLGEQVDNQGELDATAGTVALGAGSKVSLSFAGQQLLSLRVEQSTLDNLANNQGLIRAEGGQVLMNAGARDSLVASVVNNGGVIEAKGVAKKDGRIILLAGMVAGSTQVSGTLDASAKQGDTDASGGFIETSAAQVNVSKNATITTYAEHGRTGTWLIDPKDYTVAASDGDETGTALGNRLASNNIIIETNAAGTDAGNITIDDTVTWTSGNTLTLDAHANIVINKSLDASGGSGGKLALKYGQQSSSGGDASYRINAPVNLQAGANFTTQKGSGGSVDTYQVITVLGLEADASDGSQVSQSDVITLQGINNVEAGKYALGADIDASITSTWSNGFVALSNTSTLDNTARFEGLGHEIQNLTVTGTGNNKGLFAQYKGIISNVGLSNATISSTNGAIVGGLVGVLKGIGQIYNSHVTGTVTSFVEHAGGLTGQLFGSAIIDNSWADVTVKTKTSSKRAIGGLVGEANGTVIIQNSYATGNVGGNGRGRSMGGLIGEFRDGATLINSYATGAVGTAATSDNVGGLVGLLRVENSVEANIKNSYATGQVSGITKVGGLIGFAIGISNVSKSYSTGEVIGSTSVGGFLGQLGSDAVVSDSFWDTDSSNMATSAAGTGLSTSQLKNVNTFSAWDIATTGGSSNIWRIYDGYTMPLLRGLLQKLELEKQNIVYDGSAHTYDLGSSPNNLLLDSSKTYLNAQGVQSDTGVYSNQQGYDIEGAELEITAKLISISGSRSYDGSTDFAIALLSASGLIGSESVIISGTATAAAKNSGGQELDVSGIILNDSNYILANSGHLGTINAVEINLSGSRTYDGSTTFAGSLLNASGLIGSDSIVITGNATAAGKNTGSHALDVTGISLDNSNYILAGSGHQGTVDAAEISLSGSRAYDGSTDVTVGNLILSDVILGETLSLTGTASIQNKGVGEQLLSTDNLSLSNSNYQLKDGAHIITINPKIIHPQIAADDKDFDGLLTASISFIGSTDFVDEDAAALDFSSAMFASNQGTDVQVTVSGLQLIGTDASNYALAENIALTIASIFPATDSNDTANIRNASDAAGSLTQTAANHAASLQQSTPLINKKIIGATFDSNSIDTYKATAANDNIGITCHATGDSNQSGGNTGHSKGVGVEVSDTRVNTKMDACAEG